MRTKQRCLLAILGLVASTITLAATPPAIVNYQGVLRSAADQPLTGSYDVVFRLYDAETGGNEILLDRHLAANLQAVQASGGLFSTQVGGGVVVDGSGPGTYTSVAAAFRDYATLWLGVQIGAETLTPRTRIAAAGYALNASNLDGKAASSFLDTSATSQTKMGFLTVTPSSTGIAVTGQGNGGGGYFRDSGSSGFSFVGYGSFGISAGGAGAGGEFYSTTGSGGAFVGYGETGIYSVGNTSGGEFHDENSTGYAYVAHNDYGVWGSGSYAGGFFTDGDNSGNAYLGNGDWGISAYGNAGAGLFDDSNSSGVAFVAYGDEGIYAAGNTAGGEFHDADGTGYSYAGYGNTGIWASGNIGGEFHGFSGSAIVGYGDAGIQAGGNSYGANFFDANGAGVAIVGIDDDGIRGYGFNTGGYFQDANSSGLAFVGFGDRGVWGKGTFAGGTFSHPDNLTFWADVSTPTKKIQGTGTVSFVQNHPDDKDKVVVYAAPEGDEVAVYTRGTARLAGGEARVRLGETFALVANPDIGLTANVTPPGRGGALYVASVDPRELVVRTDDETSRDTVFDYMVWGLRIGFERHPVVQRKDREAFLPDTVSFDAIGAADPELGATAALARFAAERVSLGERAPMDLTRAEGLMARINEGRPAILAAAATASEAERNARAVPARHEAASVPASAPSSVPVTVPPPVVNRTTETASRVVPQLTLAPVSGSVRAGDVLVLDATMPGNLRAAERAADRGVAGCALAIPAGLEVPAGQAPVGTTGVVLCRVDASYGAIEVGDLLSTSATGAHAMRAMGSSEGAILGKAMEPLAEGAATIRVLVTLR